jgi:SAM-dependent methyltransferase
MSLFYRVAYLVGFTPWAKNAPPPLFRERIEGTQALAPGRALDLGCGYGQHAIYLAQHGWKVTGVDAQARAIAGARRRAGQGGASVEFVQGDVTRLVESGVKGPFELFLDFGCFHSMTDDERARYDASLAEVASSGAELLLFAFGPKTGRLAPRGASEDEVKRAFPGWELLESRRDQTMFLPPSAPYAGWYRLRRRA